MEDIGFIESGIWTRPMTESEFSALALKDEIDNWEDNDSIL